MCGGVPLPVWMSVELAVIPGQKVYEAHFKYIKQILTKGLIQGGYSDPMGYDENSGKMMGGTEDGMVEA